MTAVEEDAVALYKAASQAYDIDGMMATLAPDAKASSPISGRMVFRGRDDLRVLLTAVYGSMTGLQWLRYVGDDGAPRDHRRLFGGRMPSLATRWCSS